MLRNKGQSGPAGFGSGSSPRSTPQQQAALEQQALQCIRAGRYPEAAALYRQLLETGSGSASAYSNLGALEIQLGNALAATTLLRQGLQLDPLNADAWLNLGTALHGIADLSGAADALQRAIALRPGFAKAYANLGNVLAALDNPSAAIEAFNQALAIEPHYPEVLSNRGVALRESGALPAALASLQQALALRPAYPEALNNLGLTYSALGDRSQAIACYQQALALSGSSAEIHSNLGVTLMEQGDLQGAIRSFEEALRHQPHYPEAHRHLAFCLNGRQHPEALERAIRSLEASGDNPKRYHLQFAIGKYKLDRGDADALEPFLAGNALRHQQLQGRWRIPDLEALLALNADPSPLRDPLADQATECEPSAAANLPPLIFIVGLPRSGSTLVETILSTNPDLCDLGEVMDLPEALRRASDPDGIRRAYTASVRSRHRVEASTIALTDKYLYNFLYCQLIARCFPNSHLVHIYRNPMDNLLSTFTNHFPTGNEWTTSLESSVRFYHLYRQLMAAHEQAMPGRILHLNYDALTRDPERQIRRLLAHCDLPWSEAYLSPERSQRAIQTASAVQARAPIHSGSVGRWKRYSAVLQPVADQLEALGYSTALDPQA